MVNFSFKSGGGEDAVNFISGFPDTIFFISLNKSINWN